MTVKLRPINDIIAEVRAEGERDALACAERIRRGTEETVRKIELNRQAFADLDAAGIDLQLPGYSWYSGQYHEVELGFFPNTKKGNRELADKVRTVRQALGCKLGAPGKSLVNADKRIVKFSYNPDEFPGLTICFDRKLPRPKKGAAPKGKIRCRIVTERSVHRRLVCEVVDE